MRFSIMALPAALILCLCTSAVTATASADSAEVQPTGFAGLRRQLLWGKKEKKKLKGVPLCC